LTRIIELWRAGKVPAWNGMYRADDSARAVDVGGSRLPWFELGEPLDVAALLDDDPPPVYEYDIHCEAELPDGGGYVCCGEGALGADGFFARLDADRNLVWVVALDDANPLERLTVDGCVVTFTNNLGRSLTVDLTAPDFA
jgi:hypothetical protein